MQYQLFLIQIWIFYTYSTYIDKNNSDVIITYSGHNEVNRPMPEKVHSDSEIKLARMGSDREKDMEVVESERDEHMDEQTEASDVVFVPNEKGVLRNEDYKNDRMQDLLRDEANIERIMKRVKVETEAPSQDIIFVSGKNNENVERTVKESKIETQNKPADRVKLNCKNLDCNNTVNSICGGKEVERKWKYRLFMNECYFRRVNCAFKYAINRYKIVPMDHCKNIGGHFQSRPFSYHPGHAAESQRNETRRSFSSRRTLNMAVDGSFCGHSCPAHCPDHYEPQCAVSANRQRRVFLNHCLLDYNSCMFKEVWQRRPLSECVGGKKADMRQNRGFIGWLQRVGIVDKRGRLVLS